MSRERSTSVMLFGERAHTDELGHFAYALQRAFNSQPDMQVHLPADNQAADVAIYASRSPKQLKDAAAFCDEHACPLLLVATDVASELEALKLSTPVIMATNTSLAVLDAMKRVVATKQRFPDSEVSITEAHQQSKQDVSGTALTIARIIGMYPANIISLRDDAQAQKRFDIPTESLGSYAIHEITFTGATGDNAAKVDLRMFGRDSYATGAVAIVRMITQPAFHSWAANRPRVDFTDFYLSQKPAP